VARLSLFVVVAPGLEPLAAAELAELGLGNRLRTVHGGIEVAATTRQLYLVHDRGRIPTRVLVRIASGPASRFDALEQLVASIDWSRWLAPEAPIELHVASQRSRLYHEGAIAERVQRVLARPTTEGGQRIYVRVDRDRVTISLDASGESLHRRGWRSSAHAAPIRTTLAAAMVRAARYDGRTVLVDPLAGSGTIPIEAVSAAIGLPNRRPFAFQRWPSFEPGTWASVTALGVDPDRLVAPVLAADRDAGAAAAITAHLAAAGLADRVAVEHAALSAQHWPEGPGLVITNPPYGHRLAASGELRDLYAALGRRVADGGHRLCLITSERRLADACGLALEPQFTTSNGGISVTCYLSQVR
jgi:putative N6-adenine-specific DNA methylase